MSNYINTIDHEVTKGFNRNGVTLQLGGDSITVKFRSGGGLVSGVSITADVSGSFTGENLYAPYSVEGTISMDSEIYQFLLKAWHGQANKVWETSAIHITYNTATGLETRTKFQSARIANRPDNAVSEAGGESTVVFNLSLHRFLGVEFFEKAKQGLVGDFD